MIEPEAVIDAHVLTDVRRSSVQKLGVVYDPDVVTRIAASITGRIRAGTVGDGITYRELVRDSGVPSWVGYRGLLGHVLALVSLQSYDEHAVLVSALIRTRPEETPPSAGFCRFLQELGLVGSRNDRDACLELWDYHWKAAVTRLDTPVRGE